MQKLICSTLTAAILLAAPAPGFADADHDGYVSRAQLTATLERRARR